MGSSPPGLLGHKRLARRACTAAAAVCKVVQVQPLQRPCSAVHLLGLGTNPAQQQDRKEAARKPRTCEGREHARQTRLRYCQLLIDQPSLRLYDAWRAWGAAGTDLVENGGLVGKLGVPRSGLLDAYFDLAQKSKGARYGHRMLKVLVHFS